LSELIQWSRIEPNLSTSLGVVVHLNAVNTRGCGSFWTLRRDTATWREQSGWQQLGRKTALQACVQSWMR
jgi:hypothetical protein